jgi:hypothetical protein
MARAPARLRQAEGGGSPRWRAKVSKRPKTATKTDRRMSREKIQSGRVSHQARLFGSIANAPAPSRYASSTSRTIAVACHRYRVMIAPFTKTVAVQIQPPLSRRSAGRSAARTTPP